MFNNLTIQGHLTNDPVYRAGQNGGKSSCWGKIGVYQGKDQQGNDLDSMFIDFTCFGSEAEAMKNAHKGDLVVASGRFSETKSIGNDGREYINKKVVGNARMCYKVPTNNQAAPAAQPIPQQAPAPAAQPIPQQAPTNFVYVQNPQQMNPWG